MKVKLKSAKSGIRKVSALAKLKNPKSAPALKYPKLSAKTRSGRVGKKPKALTLSAARSALKSYIAAVKKSGGAKSSLPEKRQKDTTGSPAFFGPINPDALL